MAKKTQKSYFWAYVGQLYANIGRAASIEVVKSRVSNIESENSQNVGLEYYNNISDRIFPYFTTPSIKITLG
jgi:hypothetical protein